MDEGELLQVKRRYPGSTSWEPRQGVFWSIRRSLDLGGRTYALARAREVIARVVDLDDNRCHIQLVADLSNTLGHHLAGFAFLAGTGTLATGTLLTLGFFAPLAAVPVAAAVPTAFAVARSRRRGLERVQVALEQVLDRLQHGEIDVKPGVRGPRPSAFGRIADEIKKNLGT
jgi:Flp pilus assembly protein TadB